MNLLQLIHCSGNSSSSKNNIEFKNTTKNLLNTLSHSYCVLFQFTPPSNETIVVGPDATFAKKTLFDKPRT